jgi:hypothetical protein
MYKSPQLIKKQLAVIEDLFSAELDEAEILKKHGVKPSLYRKWLTDEQFLEHFEQRLAQAHHSSRVLLARRALDAAKRLIELTKCDQSETARKACLDIITARNPNAMNHVSSQEQQTTNEDVAPAGLSPETASRILAVLAENPSAPERIDTAGSA